MQRKNEVKITYSDNEKKDLLKKRDQLAKKLGMSELPMATYVRIASLNYKG